MKQYMFETNMIGFLVRSALKGEHTRIQERLASCHHSQLFISNIVLAEILFGLENKPEATRLHKAVHAILNEFNVVVFDEAMSEHYGRFKARLVRSGKNLTPLDLMIASHADGLGMTLITNDSAFFKVDWLAVEDWTK